VLGRYAVVRKTINSFLAVGTLACVVAIFLDPFESPRARAVHASVAGALAVYWMIALWNMLMRQQSLRRQDGDPDDSMPFPSLGWRPESRDSSYGGEVGESGGGGD
jgi:hypothetical protein